MNGPTTGRDVTPGASSASRRVALDRKRALFASLANAAVGKDEVDELWDALESAINNLKASMTTATSTGRTPETEAQRTGPS